MGWPQINFALEGLLLGGFVLAVVLIFARWLWERLPWRRSYGDALAELQRQNYRKFEAEQIAAMESEGKPVWRPSPSRTNPHSGFTWALMRDS